jgi:RNA polymerase sigma-70 factor (sigma-E family)
MSVWTSRRARESGFTEYVAARHDHLWRTAYALCGSRHQADDLLQIALTKLYVAWPRVHSVENPDAYVRQILVRTNIDESRRPWRREVPVAEQPDVAAPSSDPDTDDAVMSALRQLPPMQRRCVVLRHWLDLSVTDTAAELGVSEGTVKSHTSRGVARLQSLLVEVGEHG